MSSTPPPTAFPRIATSLSGHPNTIKATQQIAGEALRQLASKPCDLALLFFSRHHLEEIPTILPTLLDELKPAKFVAVSARDVLGGEVELEDTPGMSLALFSLPGVAIDVFEPESIPAPPDTSDKSFEAIAAHTHMDRPDHRGMLLFLDPFSIPANALLAGLTKARSITHPHRDNQKPPPILGGMASAGNRPGTNLLVVDDHLKSQGGIGISFAGDIAINSLVSQGCKPIGEPMVVTSCKGQLVFELGGKPAGEALTDALDSVPYDQREQLRKGLYLGRAVSEYKKRFGRDDFLMRNIIGVEKNRRAIAVADLMRTGQTVQFFMHDEQTADADLALLLDRERLYEPPIGTLLFTCTGRGGNLFAEPHHDASMVSQALSPHAEMDGPTQAKGGEPIGEPRSSRGTQGSSGSSGGDGGGIAGFFASGEIGPVGDGVYVHGHTACAAIFRACTP